VSRSIPLAVTEALLLFWNQYGASIETGSLSDTIWRITVGSQGNKGPSVLLESAGQ
jgi:hypothetical protein